MKVAIFSVSDWERRQFESLKERGWEVHLFDEKLSQDFEPTPEVADVTAIAVFADCKVGEEILSKFNRLGAILTRSTGYDHIDLEACRRRGIRVYFVPDYGSITVAEYTIGLMLALLRRFRPMMEQSWHGSFSRANLRGLDLAGKTVGLVGTGRIGREVARRLAAFSTEILAFDKYPNSELQSSIPNLRYADLEDLYRRSQIISFHVPLTAETKHIFNRNSLALLRPGTFLVNTSRGPVVETEAIIEGLRGGKLAGVALDTFESEQLLIEGEPFLPEDVSQAELRKALSTYHLLHSDRVILSPHNAYNTEEALQRIVDATIANLEAFASDSETPNRIL